MTFQTIPGGLVIPRPTNTAITSPSLQDMLIDAASEKAAVICRAGKTGTINKVGFLTGTVTTGDTVDVRLETVSAANGDPTGTLLGTDSNGSQVIGAGDDDTWFLTTLTTGVAVTEGDLFAAVIVNGGGGGDMNIRNVRMERLDSTYTDLDAAGWTKNQNNGVFAFEYSDGSYAVTEGVFPVSALTEITFNNTDTPDERGLKFKFPFPVRVTGAYAVIDLAGDCDIVLYNLADSALETVSLDKDVRHQNNAITQIVRFDGTQELAKDTYYRLVVKPTSATDLGLKEFDVDAAAIMDSFQGGQDFHHTYRTDAGSWTDTTTKRPLMGLICDAFDDGAGLVQTGMTGGIS